MSDGKILIGYRSDGLGARLINLLWTWRLARKLQARAIMVWPDLKGMSGDTRVSQIIDTATGAITALESEIAFIDGELSAYRNLDWLDLRPDWKNKARGWSRDDVFQQHSSIGNRSHHPIALQGETQEQIIQEARALSSRLPIHSDVLSALKRVQDKIDLSKVVAVNYPHSETISDLTDIGSKALQNSNFDPKLGAAISSYFRKCAPVDAYAHALELELARGSKAIIFSNSPAVRSTLGQLPALKTRLGQLFGSGIVDVRPEMGSLSTIQESFLEILIMSKCARILSTNNDSSQAAMLLGGGQLQNVKKSLAPEHFLSELADILPNPQEGMKDSLIDLTLRAAREHKLNVDRNMVGAALANGSHGASESKTRAGNSALQSDKPRPKLEADAARITAPAKAKDFVGRFREVISDPLNLLIERDPLAGVVDESNMVVLANGLRVPFSGPGAYYNEFSYVLAVNRGVHEPLEEFTFQELLKVLPPAPTMIELGAYWGHYSMWLKLRRKDATVILVEPKDYNIECGRENFRRNSMEGEFIQSFVGKGQFEVDRFLGERGIIKLDILHADIQGAEADMLDGAQASLKNRIIDYVFVSTHGDKKHKQCVAALKAVGYRVEISSGCSAHTCSYDGFIFASSPNRNPLLPGFNPLGRVELATTAPKDVVRYLSNSLPR